MQLRIRIAREDRFAIVVRALSKILHPFTPRIVLPSTDTGTSKPRLNRRSCRRVRVSLRITLSWRDAEHEERFMETRCLNMSTQGALVLSRESFAVGATVYVSVKELKRSGTAIVRHCIPHGPKFLIGVQFTELLTPDHVVRH